MSNELLSSVRDEVEALHEFFVGWFSGRLPESALKKDFLPHFDAAFTMIPTAGTMIGLGELENLLRESHGANRDFRIAIRNVRVHRASENCVLATYEEWQRNALASTPPDNARITTALFQRSDPLVWLHVHETWLPEDLASAGPWDF